MEGVVQKKIEHGRRWWKRNIYGLVYVRYGNGNVEIFPSVIIYALFLHVWRSKSRNGCQIMEKVKVKYIKVRNKEAC